LQATQATAAHLPTSAFAPPTAHKISAIAALEKHARRTVRSVPISEQEQSRDQKNRHCTKYLPNRCFHTAQQLKTRWNKLARDRNGRTHAYRCDDHQKGQTTN
jgi:hypothetical protein